MARRLRAPCGERGIAATIDAGRGELVESDASLADLGLRRAVVVVVGVDHRAELGNKQQRGDQPRRQYRTDTSSHVHATNVPAFRALVKSARASIPA